MYDTATSMSMHARWICLDAVSRNLEFRQTDAGATAQFRFGFDVMSSLICCFMELVSPVSFIIRTFSFSIREQISSKEEIGA